MTTQHSNTTITPLGTGPAAGQAWGRAMTTTLQPTIARETLERQADAIELALSTQGTPATCAGGHVTPRAIAFQLNGATAEQVTPFVTAIGRVLDVKPEAITISESGGAVWINISRSDPQPVALPKMLERIPPQKVTPITALLGLASDGVPLMIKLPSNVVGGHALITGGARSGKTSLITTAILSLAHYNQPRALQCVLIGRALAGLDRLPHVTAITLPDLVARLGTRDEHTQPAIVVAIDDLDTLSAADQQAAQELIERGAPAGVFVISATRSDDRHWPTTITAQQEQAAGAFWIEPAHGAAWAFLAAHAQPHEIDQLIKGMRRSA